MRYCSGLVAAVLVLILMPLAAGSAVAATRYGDGPYSNCGLQVDCAGPTPTPSSTPAPTKTPQPTPSTTATPPTIIHTPDGLDFAVNLSDGQIIPPPRYLVTVTPLNGQGRTAARVDFLVNQRLADTALANATGTFTWNWTVTPGTTPTVTVIVYDAAGQSVQRQIHVRIQTAAAVGQSTPSNSGFAPAALRLIQQIPVPLVYGFPYIIFVLFGLGLLVLLIQVRREVADLTVLAKDIDRLRQLRQDKATFLQLSSHYLRTPIAVIDGGVDILAAQHLLAPETLRQVKQTCLRLQSRIEQLMHTVGQQTETPTTASAGPTPETSKIKLWLHPGFWLPLLLLTILVFGFDFLAQAAGRHLLTATNTLLQLVILGLLGLIAYVLLRTRRLRRLEHHRTRQIIDEAANLDRARNTLVAGSAQALGADLITIKTALTTLPSSKGSDIAHDGCRRFERVLAKLTVAAQLETAHGAAAPPTLTELKTLLDTAISPLTGALNAKHVHLALPANATFQIRHPAWLQGVLTSLIDNALAYSPDGSQITVDAATNRQALTITVSDDGPGLASEQLNQLFHPFSKAEGALVFNHEGMGFSLYLNRLILQYLGGSITATPRAPHGLSVSLTMPVQ